MLRLAMNVLPTQGMDPQPKPSLYERAGANYVPQSAISLDLIKPIDPSSNRTKRTERDLQTIFSPRLSPSTISTEQALASRSLFSPEFKHNVHQTRLERISNLFADAPRFSRQLEILA